MNDNSVSLHRAHSWPVISPERTVCEPPSGLQEFNGRTAFAHRVDLGDGKSLINKTLTCDFLPTEGYQLTYKSEASCSAAPEDKELLERGVTGLSVEREAAELSAFERIRRAISNLPCLRGGDA